MNTETTKKEEKINKMIHEEIKKIKKHTMR